MTRTQPTAKTGSSASLGSGSRVVPLLLLAVIALIFLNALTPDEDRKDKLDELRGEASEPWAWKWEQLDTTLNEIPIFLKAQWNTALTLFLWSLIPGFAGLLYRRSFGRWFWLAFLVLYAINALAPFLDSSRFVSVSAELEERLAGRYSSYVVIEVVLILLILSVRLYWRSHRLVDLLLNAVSAGKITPSRNKNIVVCLDGTWNEPGQLDFGKHAETNVLKLFRLMKTDDFEPASQYNASDHRTYSSDLEDAMLPPERSRWAEWQAERAASVKQLALYYRGVGNKAENNPLAQKFGGAFGLGAAGIVERAYLDVARVYMPGDRLFIFGFSRGAAIARLLAGTLGRRGVPQNVLTLFLLGRHFTVWKSAKNRIEPKEVRVDVLGCWDTVGAFGVSKNILGIPFQKINLLKDLTVSQCVKRAYHMVALDETRDAFAPTLMDPDPTDLERIIEVWFAGNHANVGGGYATDKLSNVTLAFLLKRVSSGYAYKDKEPWSPPGDEEWGLYLKAMDTEARIRAEAETRIKALARARVEEPDREAQALVAEAVQEVKADAEAKLKELAEAKKESLAAARADAAARVEALHRVLAAKKTDASQLPALDGARAEAEARVKMLDEALAVTQAEAERKVKSLGEALAKSLAEAEEEPTAKVVSLEKARVEAQAGAEAIGEFWIDADPLGQIRHSTGPIYKHEPRELPLHAIIHESVFSRMRELEYAPQSLFKLNRRILEVRFEIETALKQLREEEKKADVGALAEIWVMARKQAEEKVTKQRAAWDKAQAPLAELRPEERAWAEDKFRTRLKEAEDWVKAVEMAEAEALAREALGGEAQSDPAPVAHGRSTLGRGALEAWLASHGTGTLTKDQAESAMKMANSLTIRKWPDDRPAGPHSKKVRTAAAAITPTTPEKLLANPKTPSSGATPPTATASSGASQ